MRTLHRTSTSPSQTLRLGECFGSLLSAPAIINLSAPLGGGKTWFSKGVARGVGGHDYDSVTSPAFNLVHEYVIEGAPKIYHVDFYRLDELVPEDIQMFAEYLADTSAIALVEWGDKFLPELADSYLTVRIAYGPQGDTTTRAFDFSAPESDTAYGELIERFEAAC
jgi:tRNA threonylcarbamoyladenosine biosynthesis protein TsaE